MRTEIRTQAGPQTRFLASRADIAIFGGAAGAGKTFALLMEPTRHVHNPGFGAVIFRRTTKQVREEGGLWDESMELYPGLKAQPNIVDLRWSFPSGARVGFGHLEHEKNKQDWDGAQIALIEFDQLEHFSESMFFYMLMRNRSTCGVAPYVRASCNPDPDSWLAHFLAWWIDPETGFPIPERSGQLRWFVRIGGRLEWADTPAELTDRFPRTIPKSVTFVPGKVFDNQILMARNPTYLGNLMAQGPVERARFLEGNWKVRAEAGKIFNRAWFEVVDAAPGGGVECRGWDFAATKKTLKKKDPDLSAGVKMRKVGGVYYVLDCWAEQVGPADVDQAFLNLSVQDAGMAAAAGARYMARWEEEPGSASKRESLRLVKLLGRIDAQGAPSQGDKYVRSKGLASHARVGNVKVVRGPWNEEWLQHMHNQPDDPHDDIHDASAVAFNALAVGDVERTQTSSQVVTVDSVFG